MNRTVLIGSIVIIAAGTILIIMKVGNPQKVVPAQVPDVTTAAPALAVNKSADIKSQKKQEIKNTEKQSTPSPAVPQDNKKDSPDMMSIIKEQMKDPAMRERTDRRFDFRMCVW
jgi:hypothetical protein